MHDQDERDSGSENGPDANETHLPDEGARRPTPVRAVMEGGDEDERDDPGKARVIHDEKTGFDWIVTVSGWSASGVLPLRSVPLLELVFAKTEQPEHPLRRALTHGEALEGIPDHELLSTLSSSEPFREPLQEVKEAGRGGRNTKQRERTRS